MASTNSNKAFVPESESSEIARSGGGGPGGMASSSSSSSHSRNDVVDLTLSSPPSKTTKHDIPSCQKASIMKGSQFTRKVQTPPKKLTIKALKGTYQFRVFTSSYCCREFISNTLFLIFTVPPKVPENYASDTWNQLKSAVEAIHASLPVPLSLEELYKVE
jgi:hypothetical protein